MALICADDGDGGGDRLAVFIVEVDQSKSRPFFFLQQLISSMPG